MGWLENLESLIGVDLSRLKNLNIKLISDNHNSPIVHVDNRKVTINVSAKDLSEQNRHQLQQLIRGAVSDEGYPVLDAEASRVVKQIEDAPTDILDYFRDKLPPSDVPILRAALFMREVHKTGQSVEHLKHDIIMTYGKRGNNIANFCTTGYFESLIKPMYEELSQRPDFTQQIFLGHYERIIVNAPFAVFVGATKGVSDLRQEIEAKLKRNKHYGIHQLNIHAINHENVRKVNEVIRDPTITQHFTNEPTVFSEGNILNVQIFF